MTFGGRIEAFFTVPSSTTISCTSNAGGPTAVTITAGSYTMTSFVTQLATDLNTGRPVTAGSWTVALSTGTSGTGKITIAVTAGTYSITWTSTDARDLLGFTSNPSGVSTATGASQARGVWLPDAPMWTDHYYLDAPRVTDLRSTESPTGFCIAHVGNTKYEHTNLVYSHVANNKTWLAAESTTNESFERFLIDSQFGTGHDWFSPGAKCTVRSHDSSETLVGNGTVTGWYMPGLSSMKACVKRVDAGWDGLFNVTVPRLVTDS